MAPTAAIHPFIPPNPYRDFALRALARQGGLSFMEDEAARAALADLRTARAGSELIAEGEALTNPRLMLDGWAIRQRVLRDGRRQICGFVLPGDVFGLCARRGGAALHSTVALTPVNMSAMPMLAEAMFTTPDSAAAALAWGQVTREESYLVNQVVRLGRLSAYERLIHLLLEFHERLARAGLVEDGGYRMPFTQEVLADALGLSVVHTNRMLQKLRRENLVLAGYGHVKLLTPKQLAEISDYSSQPD